MIVTTPNDLPGYGVTVLIGLVGGIAEALAYRTAVKIENL